MPIHDSTRDALAHYAQQRDQICRSRPDNTFFVSEQGTRWESSSARRLFAKVSCAIGLRTPHGSRRIGRGPRLQDLRHTFTTRCLVDWYRAGLDVGRQMPKLSTYLGHVTVANTYWYVQAVPELLGLAAEHRFVPATGGA